MSALTFSNLTLSFTGENRNFESGQKQGAAEVVLLETTDGLKAEVSIQRFHDGEIHIRLTEFLTTPPPVYAHLVRNGTMTVQVREDGKWVALLRALRPGGREHPTLNHVTTDELDKLLGANSTEWLEGLGFEVGTWESLNPAAGRFKDSVAIAIESSKANLLVAPWALTRVIALMKRLGKTTVDLT